ncbi:hypothetical protein BGZ59_007676 [Podila verticillata]|nr:hypothetical protein BGZ59_007676 [Podila verticillata]
MATDKKSKVLVVGGGTYLGHNILDKLKGLFDFTATYTLFDHGTFSTTRPWSTYIMTCFDMEESIKGLLMFGGYDWIVFSPEAYSTQRTLVAQLLVKKLRESKFEGGVIVLSHDGADHLAEKDERKQLAELFAVEKVIFGMKHLSRVYILRIAMLQEQLLFAVTTSDGPNLVLPISLDLLNPISTLDVIRCVRNIIGSSAGGYIAKRARWISYLTGPGSRTDYSRLRVVADGTPVRFFCNDSTGSHRNHYNNWLGQDPLHRYPLSLPLWPADAEIGLMREYLWYATWNLGPAKETHSDWNEICPGKERQPLVALLNAVHDYLRR